MPLISKGGLYQYLQSVQGYLAPPIAAVFLLGLFWRRINARGAVWGLSVGFLLGMVKLTVQVFFGKGKLESPAMLAALGDLNFLYFTGILFVASIVVIVLASLTAPPPPEEKLRLTYAGATEQDKRENRESWNAADVWSSAAVLCAVLGMYLYFSFWLT
jgi:SSS family solute:Na+ symporter